MNLTYTAEELQNLEKAFRIHLINAVSGFKSANMVGTISESGQTNLGMFSSVIHMGSSPALFGMILRPNPEERDTYRNIMETRQFTLNHVNQDICRKAHQTSGKYASGISEFDICGLTSEFHGDFKAPFVLESKIKLGLTYEEEHHIKANNTRLLIGRLQYLILPENVVAASGHVDLAKAKTVTIGGVDGYYKTEEIERLKFIRDVEKDSVLN